jgi:hypothetical protein
VACAPPTCSCEVAGFYLGVLVAAWPCFSGVADGHRGESTEWKPTACPLSPRIFVVRCFGSQVLTPPWFRQQRARKSRAAWSSALMDGKDAWSVGSSGGWIADVNWQDDAPQWVCWRPTGVLYVYPDCPAVAHWYESGCFAFRSFHARARTGRRRSDCRWGIDFRETRITHIRTRHSMSHSSGSRFGIARNTVWRSRPASSETPSRLVTASYLAFRLVVEITTKPGDCAVLVFFLPIYLLSQVLNRHPNSVCRVSG